LFNRFKSPLEEADITIDYRAAFEEMWKGQQPVGAVPIAGRDRPDMVPGVFV
jgi:hypothetical protein